MEIKSWYAWGLPGDVYWPSPLTPIPEEQLPPSDGEDKEITKEEES